MQKDHSNMSSKNNQVRSHRAMIKRLFEDGIQCQYQQTTIGLKITNTSLKHISDGTPVDFSLPINTILDHIKAQANL